MSKTRTGRKGRARLALATDLNALGAARTAADTEGKAALLARMMQHATGQGTSGQIFSQGEVIGALSDSLDVKPADGGQGPGIWAGNETNLVDQDGGGAAGLTANVTGEATLSAQPQVPQLASPFAHYYLTEAGTTATTTSGIAYLPSGPAGAFTPSSHSVAGGESLSISVRPSVSDLASGIAYANMYFGVTGTMHDDDSIVGRVSSHTQPTAVLQFDDGSEDNINANDELVIISQAGEVTLKIQFKANAYEATNSSGAADSIAAAAAGSADNFIVESSTLISVIEGGVATNNASNTAARVVDNLVAAIAAWNTLHSDAVEATDAGDKITLAINTSKGVAGNNDGAANKVALGNATVTARRLRPAAPGETAIATPLSNAGTENWLQDTGDNLTNVVYVGNSAVEVGGGNTIGVTEATPFSIDASSPNTDAGNAILIGHEDNKFKHCDIDITATITNNPAVSRAGLAFFWSLS